MYRGINTMVEAVTEETRIKTDIHKRNNNNIVKNNITSYTLRTDCFRGRHSIVEVDKETIIAANRPKEITIQTTM